MRSVLRLALVVASMLTLPLVNRPAVAQSGREALVQGTQAYDLADFDRAIALLSRGLDPAASPRDSLWRAGVQKLAYALLERDQVNLAETWLRWALRLEPQMVPDSVNFPPTVWLAFDRARAVVGNASRDAQTARVSWQWSSGPAPMSGGSLIVRSSGPAISARMENGDVLPAGAPRSLAPGSYSILAATEGYEGARVTVEVLPGVATQLLFDLRKILPGLLYVASQPWGTVYLDSERIGYTAIAAHPVAVGAHRLRIERDGYAPFDTTIAVGENQRVRLGPIRLWKRGGDEPR